MASFSNLYNEIEYRIKKAVIQIREYRLEQENLKRENAQLKEEVVMLKKELLSLRENHNLLAISKTLLKKEDKKEAQKRINDIVREIDNCIMLLKR